MGDYERAVALIEASGVEADFDGPKPAELIERAEAAVGIRFPPTYRRFLAEYGVGGVGGTEIYGVVDDDFASSSIPDAIWLNLTLRREGHADRLFAFYDVGDGWSFCLDTERVGPDGELPVVAVPPGGDGAWEEIAPDFGAAFLLLVQQELGLGDDE